jgi:CelD/BcsL family acetyltransferase involved in cellulose biosynthesis
MHTRAVDPITDPAWAELMAGPRGNLFGSPPWIAALVETYGFTVSARIIDDGTGHARGGLAHAELRDFVGDRIVSLPFSDYLDPIAADDEEWRALVAPLIERSLPVRLRVLDAEVPRLDARFEQRGTFAWHRTDLTRSEADIHGALASGLRQNVRAAERRGATVRFGTDLEDVRVLHLLHRSTRKHKYRMLAQPLSFFENLWKSFAPFDGIIVGQALHEGDVVAAALYLIWNDVLYFKCAASRADRLAVRPNELLAWESLRLGHGRGLREYDWGVSDVDQPGLIGYKRKFATDERLVSVLQHTPAGSSDRDGPEVKRVLGDLTDAFTRADVPDAVTQRAGEILYRYFA